MYRPFKELQNMKVAVIFLSLMFVTSQGYFESNRNFDDDEDDIPAIFNYNQYLQRPYSTRVDSKSKVETLGKVLKGNFISHYLCCHNSRSLFMIYLLFTYMSI